MLFKTHPNFSVMAFIIGLPCLQIILFCWAIGHDPQGLRLAITNHELANFTELSSSSMFTEICPITEGCNSTMLSCRFLSILQRKGMVIVSIKTGACKTHSVFNIFANPSSQYVLY